MRDAAAMWRFAGKAGFARDLKALHHPRVVRALLAAMGDWSLIALATIGAIAVGWAAVPFALLVIGNRQRALGNLLHDASHLALDANRRRGALIADVLLCWPLWTPMSSYRDEHNRHHKYLGDVARDPDLIHDEDRPYHDWVVLWIDQIRSPRMIRNSLVAHLDRLDANSLAGIAGWWIIVLGAIAASAGTAASLSFLALWLGARVTAFHAITAFREISDHVGLRPGGLIAFSRNHPFSSLASHVFHPHHNGYHLLHHLAPGLPYYAMPRAHALLMRWPPYAAGEHCTSYFAGRSSAVRSWVRRWRLLPRPGPTRT